MGCDQRCLNAFGEPRVASECASIILNLGALAALQLGLKPSFRQAVIATKKFCQGNIVRREHGRPVRRVSQFFVANVLLIAITSERPSLIGSIGVEGASIEYTRIWHSAKFGLLLIAVNRAEIQTEILPPPPSACEAFNVRYLPAHLRGNNRRARTIKPTGSLGFSCRISPRSGSPRRLDDAVDQVYLPTTETGRQLGPSICLWKAR